MEESIIALSLLPKSLIDHYLLHKFLKLTTPPDFEFIWENVATTKSKRLIKFNIKNIFIRTNEIIQILKTDEIKIAHYWSENYPEKLKYISDPPVLLYYKGELPKSHIKTLAIVGSRNPDNYGILIIENIVKKLSLNIQHVSGLAKGIDTLAHIATLNNSITNFAVLGNGIDSIYPHEHKIIAEKILNTGGGIISEYPPRAEIRPYFFPHRNRIISAFSDVIWIPQGTAKSGSLHTAIHALDQNKIIAVTPGNIFDELSDLPNRLLQEGAHPVLKVDDIELLLN